MTNSNIEIPPFITVLKTGGTKEEAIFALERMWDWNCALRKALADLVEINRRDEKGDPDFLATDWWRDEVWENANKTLTFLSNDRP